MASILKVDTIQDQSGNNIINENANTITIGASGDTVTIPTGASLTVPSGGLSGQNYPAFEAYLSAAQTFTNDTTVKVNFDTETFDSDGCYDNATNYRFTPTVAGKYFVYSTLQLDGRSNANLNIANIQIHKNGSAYKELQYYFISNYIRQVSTATNAIIDMNGSTDYIEIYAYISMISGALDARLTGGSNKQAAFGAYRIGS